MSFVSTCVCAVSVSAVDVLRQFMCVCVCVCVLLCVVSSVCCTFHQYRYVCAVSLSAVCVLR